MTIVKTKRHPLKFYITIIFGFGFFASLGSLLIYIGIKEISTEESKAKEYLIPIIGVLIYFLAIWMVYSYYKNSPKIIIDKYNLKIGNQQFYTKNIKDVILTGKMPFRFIFNYPMEGMTILFKDGTEKILFDDMYTNSHEIKSFLEQVVIKKQTYISKSSIEINRDKNHFENTKIYRGNQFTSLRGVTAWSLVILFAFVIIFKINNLSLEGLVFLIIFGLSWFIFNSWLMNYFLITNEYLIVRNHNHIWKEKIYHLSNIKEIVFESNGQQPNCMRIITKDFKNKLYPAGTLRDKTWLKMKRKLELKGVIVRNECIYEY